MFSSRKKDKDKEKSSKEKDADSESLSKFGSSGTGSDGYIDVAGLNDLELNALSLKIMTHMNIKNPSEVLKKFDRNKKVHLCQQQQQSATMTNASKKGTAALYCQQLKKAMHGSKEDELREHLVSLRISLSTLEVPWIEDFGREGGFKLLVNMLDRISRRVEKLHGGSDASSSSQQEVDDAVFTLQELLKCVRAIMNTWPGVCFVLKTDSNLCAMLIETLSILNSTRSAAFDQSVVNILGLLAAISFLDRDRPDEFEITGNAVFVRDLSVVAEKRSVPRFACIINCFKSGNPEIMYRALLLINALFSCIEETEWQVRMIWRNEFMASGLREQIPVIEKASGTNENLRRVYAAFTDEKKADQEDFNGRFEKLQGDVNNPDDCVKMLVASCKDTDCEDLLYEILIRLVLVNDRKYKRASYFEMFRRVINAIAFNDGLEQGKQIVFNTPLEQSLKEIDNDANASRMNKRLETAVSAKQEAFVMQGKYYEKMVDLQRECEKLRKHISNPSEPLPAPTSCDLPAPNEAMSMSVSDRPAAPLSKSAPPPPPPPPPNLLSKGGLPSVKVGGGPPPPPPPPPNLLGKPGSAAAKSGPGPPVPPPPPGFNLNSTGNTMIVEIPDFLKPKVARSAGVPMKRIPWNSDVIKPTTLTPESVWAQIDESKLASDDVFEYLKSKFSSAPANKNTPASTKVQLKTKEPVVIKDAKTLQALAILQGSQGKLSHKDWRRSILKVDGSTLNASLLGQLRAVIPDVETLRKVKECAATEFDSMPEGEQFVAVLASINSLPIRLESMELKFSWSDTIAELKSSISTVAEACEEVHHSAGLKCFISLVLLAGNFMGQAKNTKETYAFELNVLNKLADTKDSENSETLLHSLIVLLDRKSKGRYTNFVAEDLHHVDKAARVELAEIASTKASLDKTLKRISAHLVGYGKQGDEDKFLETMTPFISKAEKELSVVQGMWEVMQSKWSALQKFLCCDAKKYPMETLFGNLKAFKDQYEAARREILLARDRQEAASKQKKRTPLKSIQANATPANDALAKVLITTAGKATPAEDHGIMDRIEDMLHTGNFPRTNKTGRRVRRPAIINEEVFSESTRKRSRVGNKLLENQGADYVPTTEELLRRLGEL